MSDRRPCLAIAAGFLSAALISVAYSADRQPAPPSLSILFPGHDAAVGNRVNLVLDPATEWSSVPFFQVLVGTTEYPVVDTSNGRHAFQGLAMARGLNTITVRGLVPAASSSETAGAKGKELDRSAGTGPGTSTDHAGRKFIVVQSRSIVVYNREGNFSLTPPRNRPAYFHTRENEAECSGCHRLEVGPRDRAPEKPQDVLCYACHRDTPSGKYIHGPAAVWNCLVCHDPDRAPVRYQFAPADLWTVTKTAQPVETAVFTLSADALFVPSSAALVAVAVTPDPPGKKDRQNGKKSESEPVEARAEELAGRKVKQRELFQEVLEYVKQNPLDRIRIEVHGEGVPLAGEKDGGAGTPGSIQQLTEARAQVIAKVLREYGVPDQGRITAVGMGATDPKATGAGREAQALNDRVEIIVTPAAMQARGSFKLPAVADRERVILELSYARGPAVRELRVLDRLPPGMQYVKGSALVGGRVKDPQVRGDELVWQLGDPGTNVHETISYLVRKEKEGAVLVPTVLRLLFTTGKEQQARDFDPTRPEPHDRSVQDVCARCHADILSRPFKHGPAEAGYCSLCHDPHASDHPAWTRDQDWQLCTTCHAEKKTAVHMISGFVRGVSHPTEKVADPSRPGKRLGCVSCHSPHSSQMKELLGFEARSNFEICRYCHRGK